MTRCWTRPAFDPRSHGAALDWPVVGVWGLDAMRRWKDLWKRHCLGSWAGFILDLGVGHPPQLSDPRAVSLVAGFWGSFPRALG